MFDALSDCCVGGQHVCLMGAFALDAMRDLLAVQIRSYFEGWIAALSTCLAHGNRPPG